jgi:hypothetical protein
MKRPRATYLSAGAFLLILFMGLAVRLIFPPFANLLRVLPMGNFTSAGLFREFAEDQAGASMLLAGQVIIVEGIVSESGKRFIRMDKGLYQVKCVLRNTLYDRPNKMKPGDRITIKGVCEGLNMTEVVMDHCIILNSPSR